MNASANVCVMVCMYKVQGMWYKYYVHIFDVCTQQRDTISPSLPSVFKRSALQVLSILHIYIESVGCPSTEKRSLFTSTYMVSLFESLHRHYQKWTLFSLILFYGRRGSANRESFPPWGWTDASAETEAEGQKCVHKHMRQNKTRTLCRWLAYY